MLLPVSNGEPDHAMSVIHASCVAIGARGVLLCGESGSGKSDLALRLIDAGAELVADDYVALTAAAAAVYAAPPDRLAGLIEVRGLGLVQMPYRAGVAVALAVTLAGPQAVARLPEPRESELEGVGVPAVTVAAFEASAAAKTRFALRALAASEEDGYALFSR